MSFTRPFLLGPVFFRTALPCSGGYHMERGGMPLHVVVGINCKKGVTTEVKDQLSSVCAKGCILMTRPNSLTSLHKFSSESSASVVSSVNYSSFNSNLPHFTRSSSSTFLGILAFTSRTTKSIYTLNNHGDITQPCLTPTLTGNHSLTSIPCQH